jgi:hypothetical protein
MFSDDAAFYCDHWSHAFCFELTTVVSSIVSSKPFVLLFSQALDAVKLACQEIGIFCPFLVIDPT